MAAEEESAFAAMDRELREKRERGEIGYLSYLFQLNLPDLIPMVLIGLPIMMLPVGMYLENNYKAQLLEKVKIVADINRDGVTTQEELNMAYARAGLIQPPKFSRRDLEKIIAAYK